LIGLGNLQPCGYRLKSSRSFIYPYFSFIHILHSCFVLNTFGNKFSYIICSVSPSRPFLCHQSATHTLIFFSCYCMRLRTRRVDNPKPVQSPRPIYQNLPAWAVPLTADWVRHGKSLCSRPSRRRPLLTLARLCCLKKNGTPAASH